MPAPKKKNAQVQTQSDAGKEVVYDHVKASVKVLSSKEVKALLGWETEAEFIKRQKEKNPNVDESTLGFVNPLLKDFNGESVVCWRNHKNRPFDEQHAKRLAQDHLTKNWRLNGESVIISKFGTILSAQHRLIGFELACQKWRSEKEGKHWRKYWPEEPTFETVIVTGVEEDQETVQTLDNVKPRSLSDVFYTSPLYENLKPKERLECSRMLDACISLLWKRTGEVKDEFQGYQTHSAAKDFLDRHPTILRLVKWVFSKNRDREISGKNLSPGAITAAAYLMASCTSNGDKYRELDTDKRNEKAMDFDKLDLSERFVEFLATSYAPTKAVVESLASIVDEDSGATGRLVEKLVIMAKGWEKFKEPSGNEEFSAITSDDIGLETMYEANSEGVLELCDFTGFGGIDVGPQKPKKAKDPTPEELEKAKEEERQKRAEALAARIEQSQDEETEGSD